MHLIRTAANKIIRISFSLKTNKEQPIKTRNIIEIKFSRSKSNCLLSLLKVSSKQPLQESVYSRSNSNFDCLWIYSQRSYKHNLILFFSRFEADIFYWISRKFRFHILPLYSWIWNVLHLNFYQNMQQSQ